MRFNIPNPNVVSIGGSQNEEPQSTQYQEPKIVNEVESTRQVAEEERPNQPPARVRDIEIINNVFSPEWCDELVSYMEKHPSIGQGSVGYQQGEEERGRINEEIRNCTTGWLDVSCDYSNQMFNEVLHQMKMTNMYTFGFDLENIEIPQYTRYDYVEGGADQHYNWHIDSYLGGMGTRHDRKLSASIQLTDPSEYEGGDLLVGDDARMVEDPHMAEAMRQKVTVIFFPSFLRHCVTPVTRGSRSSLVVWGVGPDWR